MGGAGMARIMDGGGSGSGAVSPGPGSPRIRAQLHPPLGRTGPHPHSAAVSAMRPGGREVFRPGHAARVVGQTGEISSSLFDGASEVEGFAETEARRLRLVIARYVAGTQGGPPPLEDGEAVAQVLLVRREGRWMPPVIEDSSGSRGFDAYALGVVSAVPQEALVVTGNGSLRVRVARILP